MRGTTASVTVRNTGTREGATLAQVYLTASPTGRHQRLAGFEKVWLKPGEAKTVTIALEPRVLADYATDGFVRAKGACTFATGEDAERVGAPLTVNLPMRRLGRQARRAGAAPRMEEGSVAALPVPLTCVMPSSPARSPRSRVTMGDVAAAAGVSKITVSRALRGSVLVKAEVRQQIAEIAAGMGYRVNLAARDLRLRQRRRIAVVVDLPAHDDRSWFDPYPLALLAGIMQECAQAGFAVVLTTGDPAMIVEAQDTSGIVVLGQGAHHHAVRALSHLDLPLAVWGADDGVEKEIGAAVVGSDNRAGGALAAEHLLREGRRDMVFLGDVSHAEIADRLAGFRARLADVAAASVSVLNCDFSVDGARRALAAFLDGGGRCDGIFAGSDFVAIGAMRALRDAGARPGADAGAIGIVGYDDTPAAAAQEPRLTSIGQDWNAGGRLLAATLLAQLVTGDLPASGTLPVSISVRET